MSRKNYIQCMVELVLGFYLDLRWNLIMFDGDSSNCWQNVAFKRAPITSTTQNKKNTVHQSYFSHKLHSMHSRSYRNKAPVQYRNKKKNNFLDSGTDKHAHVRSIRIRCGQREQPAPTNSLPYLVGCGPSFSPTAKRRQPPASVPPLVSSSSRDEAAS
jgi:hypothetical protein